MQVRLIFPLQVFKLTVFFGMLINSNSLKYMLSVVKKIQIMTFLKVMNSKKNDNNRTNRSFVMMA